MLTTQAVDLVMSVARLRSFPSSLLEDLVALELSHACLLLQKFSTYEGPGIGSGIGGKASCKHAFIQENEKSLG